MAEIKDFSGIRDLLDTLEDALPDTRAILVLTINNAGAPSVNYSRMELKDICLLSKALDSFLAHQFDPSGEE